MKIVIDVPDDYMKYIDIYEKGSLFDMVLTNAIKNGISLPKGHGRLIDADKLNEELTLLRDGEYFVGKYEAKLAICSAQTLIDNASTVVEMGEEKDNADSN